MESAVPDFLFAFGLIAVILTVTALASGFVERLPISFPLIFLGLGFALSRFGFGVLDVGPHSEVLEIVATLTLALVLFLDAVKMELNELGKGWVVPVLILGPGTVLIIVLGAVPLALLVGFGWLLAFIGGAILASTDPVVLREILRDNRIPRSVRQVLKIEGGMNDLVVLPVILVLIAVARSQVGSVGEWAPFLLKLLVLGPAIGFAIGGAGSWLIAKADAKMGIRLEHQALFGIGLVFAAYTASTAAGGDGFLGAFFAGLAVVVLNQSLCQCFLDYGEVTSEMAMLLVFVLFGSVLSGMLGSVPLVPALVLAALVIFVIRPGVLALVLAKARISWEARAFLCWFGPRGLNSLLLALIVVQADVAGSELLLATVGLVVIASVVIHGASATPVSAWYERRVDRETLAEERESTAAGLFGSRGPETVRVGPAELSQMLEGEDAPIILDVRSRSSYERDDAQIPGSVRVLPDEVLRWGSDNNVDRPVVAYCT
ncbi:MAG: cation:proton antiporter [Chloroflexi bacterium]|nr:cation:proton antiporter [Chloroflexota bacterium]